MTLYHATATTNIESIKRDGLIPRAGLGGDTYCQQFDPWCNLWGTRPPSVYLTSGLDHAKVFSMYPAAMNHTTGAIFRVNLPDDLKGELITDEQWSKNAYRLERSISPFWLHLVAKHIPIGEARALNFRLHLIRDIDERALVRSVAA